MIFSALLTAGMAFAASPAAALSSDWWEGQSSRVRLIASETALGADGTLLLGLEFELIPGWKTYWRTPGEAGIPPQFDWSKSANLGTVEIAWPAPHRVEYYGLDAFTYAGRVVLPVTIRAASAAQDVELKLSVGYGVCSDLCVLESADLALALPAGAAEASPHAGAIAGALALVPGPATGRLTLRDAVIRRDAGATGIEIAVTGWSGPGGAPMAPEGGYDVFVEAGEEYLFGRARYQPDGNGDTGKFIVPLIAGPEGSHQGLEVRVTAVSPAGAVEVPLIVSDPGS